MDLRCRKTNCLYNKDLTCQAKNIKITNKLVCETFKRDPKKQGTDFSKLIFSENPPRVADYKHLKSFCLTCEAKCLFNKDCHCISNGITVNPVSTDTPKCITFMKP